MNKQTEAFKNAWLQIKGLETELRAYELTFAVLKEALRHDHPDFVALADDSLAAARVSPALAERMRQIYDVPLEKLLQPGVEVLSMEEVLQLLRMPVQSNKVQ
jgi:hypothetical protein